MKNLNKTVYVIILMLFVLPGCAHEMTKWQLESSWHSETVQLTNEQSLMVNRTNFCENLGEHEVEGIGFSLSDDIAIASKKVDNTVDSLGGNAYYLKGSEWIHGTWGETLHVLFDAYKCDNLDFPIILKHL